MRISCDYVVYYTSFLITLPFCQTCQTCSLRDISGINPLGLSVLPLSLEKFHFSHSPIFLEKNRTISSTRNFFSSNSIQSNYYFNINFNHRFFKKYPSHCIYLEENIKAKYRKSENLSQMREGRENNDWSDWNSIPIAMCSIILQIFIHHSRREIIQRPAPVNRRFHHFSPLRMRVSRKRAR